MAGPTVVIGILTVNVGAAAVPRAEALLEWLAARPEDVFLLTETSSGPGTALLLERFRAAGFHVQHALDLAGERGAAIVSRIPIVASLDDRLTGLSLPGRVAFAHLDTQPATAVMAIYVPSRDRSLDKTERKQQFIASLLRALKQLPPAMLSSLIIGGDYNVIARTHDPLHAGFLDFEFGLLDTLRRLGMTDAYERSHPGRQAYSWIGRTGDGYRYDYLHVGEALATQITDSDYLHETRERRLTDHAAMNLTINISAPARLDTLNPLASTTGGMTLF